MESCPLNVECVLGEGHEGDCVDADHYDEAMATAMTSVQPPASFEAPAPAFSLQDLLGAVSQLIDQKLAPVVAKVEAVSRPQAQQGYDSSLSQGEMAQARAEDPMLGRSGRFARRVSIPSGPALESDSATPYWGKPISGLPHQRGDE